MFKSVILWLKQLFPSGSVNIKQLLDGVEHDIMNYQNLVSVLSAEAEGWGR